MTLLKMTGIKKKFARIRVLDGVDFDLKAGEVHVLAGENGAGKSTLIKILAGIHPEYEGATSLAPGAAVTVIHQELSLVDSMSVLDNIFLGHEKTRAGLWLDRRSQRQQAKELCRRVGLEIDLESPVEALSMCAKNQIEIVKALVHESNVIVMDEPTSALTDVEVERLFALIGELKARGCGIVYISHKMEEIYRLADRITVLRDGRSVGTAKASELPQAELIRRMIGRELKEQFPQKLSSALGPERLTVENFSLRSAPTALRPTSFSVRAGEVVGIAGLQGSGNSELLNAIFGTYGSPDSGRVLIDGRELKVGEPARSIANGLTLLTNDRKTTGLILDLSIRENVTLASLGKFSPGGVINTAREREAASRQMQSLSIRASGPEQEVRRLSGGNQQKVAFAKWLQTKPKILLLDEPTRGVDVGAKHGIYELIRECTAGGMAIVLITSEMPELLALADRILVMHRGRITARMEREHATQEKILKAAMGVTEEEVAYA